MKHCIPTIKCVACDGRRLRKGVFKVLDHRKQAVSIRLGEGDVRNIKRMAQRLGVRDSDIIRYAIKSMLNRISPICDEAICGRNLVPVLVESGDELIRYFELDSYRLNAIINDKADEATRVDRDDIALLAMNGLREQYLVMRMRESNGAAHESVSAARSLRNYLYDKYVYRSDEALHADSNGNGASIDSAVRVGHQRPAA